LSDRGYTVDLLAYDIGEDRDYPNFSIIRVKSWPKIRHIKPGFSLKKPYYDLFLSCKMFAVLLRQRYDVIHAVEESAFVAMFLGWLFRIPYVYDMDSNMTTQLVNDFRWLRPLRPLLNWIESLPMRNAAAVVPVCDALADEVREYRQDNIYTLKDISLAKPAVDSGVENIRQQHGISGPILMYIGNLEPYQGIDLLLQGFAVHHRSNPSTMLVVIGGEDENIDAYRNIAQALGIGDNALFLGKRPVGNISGYMQQADVLVSPRIEGVNTPMKIYSYLDSGVAVLATDLPTHNQVMDASTACLVEPSAGPLAAGIDKLLASTSYRSALAKTAATLVAREHSYSAYCKVLYSMYDDLGEQSCAVKQ
jgi:glycosyltransferase involved in cell wall biosynthesis